MFTDDENRTNRERFQQLAREELESYQLARLNRLLSQVLSENLFYRTLFGATRLQLASLDEIKTLPTSTKSDWISDSEDGIARHHSYTFDAYRRYHRTSGSRGKPMVILDTEEDWRWWTDTWQYVLDAANIQSQDRILMAFSFGPFIGFWSAHDACLQRGCMVIPSGGMSTIARIDLIESAKPTVLFSTPSYAMHLAQEADDRGKSMRGSSIRKVFVAGEPGGSIESDRKQLETYYDASVMDHAGATEIGPWGFGSVDGKGLHVIESEFIAEFLPLESHESPSGNLECKELVLTALGRTGAPVIRYRTGDLVSLGSGTSGDTNFVRLEGGVLGRTDDMFVVRGVNVFPTSIEAVIRGFGKVREYRILVRKKGALDEISIEAELPGSDAPALEEALLVKLGLRVPVHAVSSGSIPPSEGKSRRIVRL